MKSSINCTEERLDKQQHLQQLQAKQLLRDNCGASKQPSLSTCAHSSQIHTHERPIRSAFQQQESRKIYRHRSEENLHNCSMQQDSKRFEPIQSHSGRDKVFTVRENDVKTAGQTRVANGLRPPILRCNSASAGLKVQHSQFKRCEFGAREEVQQDRDKQTSGQTQGNDLQARKDELANHTEKLQDETEITQDLTPQDRKTLALDLSRENIRTVDHAQESPREKWTKRKMARKQESDRQGYEGERGNKVQQTQAKSKNTAAASSFHHHPSLGYAVNRPEFNIK